VDDAWEYTDFNLATSRVSPLLRIDPCHTALKHIQGTHAGGDAMRRQIDNETGWRLVIAHRIAQRCVGLEGNEHMVVQDVNIDGRKER
jgi:hypothetical protein